MSDHERRGFSGAPDWLIWTMTFINRIGFPIAVALYLGWLQINALPKIAKSLDGVNTTMAEVKTAINENTQVLRSWRGPSYRNRGD